MKDVQQGVFNVAYVGQGVKDVQQKGTRVEKIEKNFKKTSERKKDKVRKRRRSSLTWWTCGGRV